MMSKNITGRHGIGCRDGYAKVPRDAPTCLRVHGEQLLALGDGVHQPGAASVRRVVGVSGCDLGYGCTCETGALIKGAPDMTRLNAPSEMHASRVQASRDDAGTRQTCACYLLTSAPWQRQHPMLDQASVWKCRVTELLR